MRRTMFAALVLGGALSAASLPAAAGEKIKLLTSFEKDEVLKWDLGKKWSYVEQDGVLVTRKAIEFKKIGWIKGEGFPRGVGKGDASNGEWAFFRRFSDKKVRWYLKSGKTHEEILHSNGTVFKTFGFFRKCFPSDWSGYDRLRIDVKSTKVPALVDLMVEDEMISPPVWRQYRVPAGKWVTVEFDLKGASGLREIRLSKEAAKRLGTEVIKGRLLNPAKMGNLRLRVRQTKAATTLLVDNIRLLAPGARDTSRLEVLADKSPLPVPQELPFVKEPRKPSRAPGGRNWKPIKGEKPVKAGLKKCGAFGMMNLPRGVAVADNDRILFIGSVGRVQAAQTVDGGKTWTALGGGKPDSQTRCQHSANAPGNGAWGDGENGYVVYTARCGGASTPVDMYFRQVKFDGTGWKLGEPRLLDIAVRHCPEHKVRGITLPNGRLWAVWMHHDRFRRNYLRGRYSDDGGQTWRSPDSNCLRMIERRKNKKALPLGVTWWQENPGGWSSPAKGRSGWLGTSFHPHANFTLVRYGKTIDCLYGTGTVAQWTWFDTKKGAWTKSVLVAGKCRGPGTAVTLGKDTVYASLFRNKAVVRLNGGKWVQDTPPGYPGGGVLSLAGKTLFCFWKEDKAGKAGETLIRMSKKPVGGKWSAAVTLAEEEQKIQGISAPAYAPKNFAPVFWGPKKGWVKFLRIPVKGGDRPADGS